MKQPSKCFSLLACAAMILFLVTGAVAAVILCRPFYYSQIQALDLPARTGFSAEVIREAFDQVMDYLVKAAPFGTGELRWSESGMAHFADCKVLFQLNFRILAVCAGVFLLLFTLSASKKIVPYRFYGQGPCFWAFAILGAVMLTLAVWAVIDFTSLFTAFHTLFFPGKENWIFDYRLDEIILILPEDFWLRAAALAAGLALGAGALAAGVEALLRRLLQPKSVYEELRNLD